MSHTYAHVVTAETLTHTEWRVTVRVMSAQTENAVGPWRPADTLAARAVLVRRQLGLSQREAAIRTGIGYGTWQGMEDGRAVRHLDQIVSAIVTAFGVDRDWLMWGGSLADPAGQYRSSTDRYLPVLDPAIFAAAA